MKKSDPLHTDYSQPMRQSYVAILLIIYRYYKILFRQLWPLVIIFFFKKGIGGDYMTPILVAVIVISLLSMGLAILDFYRYYFFIENDELHVRKGVFKKKQLSIPLERVQTINFEENIIHRIFSVVSLKIDTAGSKNDEFDLDAINFEDAEQIRDYILHQKKTKTQALNAKGETLVQGFESLEAEDRETAIMKLNVLDLIKIGISYNHFRSAAWIIAGFFWISSQLDDLELYPSDLDVEGRLDEVFKSGLMITAIAIVFFFAVSFIVSMVRTVIRHYDLRFMRRGNGFKIISGLITRQEYAALDNKIQLLAWKDNLLQKHLFGIFDFKLKQAGSVAINSKKAISIPGLNKEHIDQIIANYIPGLQLEAMELQSVEVRMLYRKLIYLGFIAIPLFGFLLFYGIYEPLSYILPFIIYLVIVMYKNYHKTKYAIAQDVVLIKGGTFGDENALLKDYKIQSVKIKQNYYQRRHKLASLRISTASGHTEIPYIPYQHAVSISDYLLYKVEKSRRSWM